MAQKGLFYQCWWWWNFVTVFTNPHHLGNILIHLNLVHISTPHSFKIRSFCLCLELSRFIFNFSFRTIFYMHFCFIPIYFLPVAFKSFVPGQTSIVRSSSSRILSMVTYWTSVVILAGFSASFVSYLTVRYPVIPFNTFPELLEKGTYRLGVLRYSSIAPYFQVCMTCCSKRLKDLAISYVSLG
jgi:hypothetical protein